MPLIFSLAGPLPARKDRQADFFRHFGMIPVTSRREEIDDWFNPYESLQITITHH
jgi:predicted naringenin-chalcone synthase